MVTRRWKVCVNTTQKLLRIPNNAFASFSGRASTMAPVTMRLSSDSGSIASQPKRMS